MRTCQFCGATLESEEPSAQESAPSETPFAEAVPAPPMERVEPERAAPAGPPEAFPTPRDPASPLEKLPVADGSDAVDAGLAPQPAKTRENPPAKKSGMACAVPALIGLVVIWLLIFVGYRTVLRFTGTGFSPADSTREQGSASSASAAGDLGIDVYPAARAVSGPDRRTSADSTVVSQSFVSPAKMDLVIDFYKARMAGQTSIYASGSGVVVSISTSSQDTIQVGIAPEPGGGTRFAITHTTEKSAQ